jgi:glutaredoxin
MSDSTKNEAKKDIKVFSLPTCPYCVQAKNYLKSKNIEFEEIDLEKQPDWGPKMVARTGVTQVPQIWIGDKVILGFDRITINNELGIDNF